MKLHGEQIVIKQWDDTLQMYVAIAASKSCDIQVKVDAIETASVDSATFKTYKTYRKGWTMKMDHLVLTPTSVLNTGYTYSIGVMVTENDTTTRALYGLALCQQADVQATRGQLAKGSFQFLGTGDLMSDEAPAPPSPDVPGGTVTIDGSVVITGDSLLVDGEEMASQAWVLEVFESGGGGGAGGITLPIMWGALGTNTDEQINISHLATALDGFATRAWVIGTALNGYATESWVTTQLGNYALATDIPTNNNQLTNGAGYITLAALNGYATESWVTTQLGNYALTTDIPTNNNQLTNGAGYITLAALNGYATENWVINTALSGYATESWVTDTALDGYATESWVTGTALSGYATESWVTGTALSGYATQNWVTTNYVSIAFFSRLFTALNGSTNVAPNDVNTTIDSIKAMVGLWTEQYISALGQGSGGGGGGGIDMSVVWSALAGNTNEQINASHLETALTGYALSSQIPTNNNQLANGAGYITSSGSCSYATSAKYLTALPTIGSGADTHATALQSYFNNHKADIPRDCLTANYSSAYQNASMYMGYFLDGHDDAPYGGFFVAHYNTPYYVGILGGTFTQQQIITSSTIGSQSVSHATTAGSATTAGTCTGNSATATTAGSCTGNSATATKLASSVSLWGNSFDGSGNLTGDITANLIGNVTGNVTGNLTGNAATATKLASSVSLWGNSFDGSGNLTGDITANLIGNVTGNLTGNAATATKLAASKTIWGQSFDGSGDVSGNMSSVGSIEFTVADTPAAHSGGFRIGKFDETGGLKMQFGSSAGNIRILNTSWTNALFEFTHSGDFTATNSVVTKTVHATVGIYSDGYVSALGQNTSSDERLKKIVDYKALPTIEDIAKAPAIHYTWKDKAEMGMQVGSIAQYWQQLMPEAVHANAEGYLSMQYDVIALISAISIAREVVNLDERVAALEKENRELRNEIHKLKTA